MTDVVTMRGQKLELEGRRPKVGDQAPDFTVIDVGLNEVVFSHLPARTFIISAAPSLDTPVCDAQTRRFSQEAGRLGGDVEILTISMDLPFAQKRWCGAAGVENLRVLSDHREASFGKAYGVLIKHLRLLARAVVIIDKERKIRYIQVVDEVTHEPDYEEALRALSQLRQV